MREFYDNNPGFKAYVDRYCKKHCISVDEALTHSLVRETYSYYKEEVNNDTSKR